MNYQGLPVLVGTMNNFRCKSSWRGAGLSMHRASNVWLKPAAVHAQARRNRLEDLNSYSAFNPITGKPTGRTNMKQRAPEIVDIRPEDFKKADKMSPELEHLSQVGRVLTNEEFLHDAS